METGLSRKMELAQKSWHFYFTDVLVLSVNAYGSRISRLKYSISDSRISEIDIIIKIC